MKNKSCSGTIKLSRLSNDTIDFANLETVAGDKCNGGIPIKIEANYETAVFGETLSFEGDDVQVENIIYDPVFVEEIKNDYLTAANQLAVW